MSKKRKPSAEELLTVKVRKHVKDAILEIQALLQLKDHKHYSHSDIVEYALSCIPELKIPLPSSVKIIQDEVKNRRQSR